MASRSWRPARASRRFPLLATLTELAASGDRALDPVGDFFREREGEVEDALGELRRQRPGTYRQQLEAHARRLGGEQFDQFRQHHLRQKIVAEHAEHPGRLRRIETGGARQRSFDLIQGAAQWPGKRRGEPGRDHPVALAHEERIAEGVAQPAERGADRRLAQPDALADARRVRLAKHRVKHAKQVEVEGVPIHHANRPYAINRLD